MDRKYKITYSGKITGKTPNYILSLRAHLKGICIQFQTFPAFHTQDMPGELRKCHDFDSFPVRREEILSCLFHKSVFLRVGNRFV